jgi:hypothetical protein
VAAAALASTPHSTSLRIAVHVTESENKWLGRRRIASTVDATLK